MKVLEQRDRLSAAGATALFVVFDEPELVRERLLAGIDVPFPVLVDRKRSAYRGWGLRRAGFPRVWLDPRVWLAYVRELARGNRFRGLGSDTLQLGGDFVVGPDGRIVSARPQVRDTRPPVTVLLQELEAAASPAGAGP